MAMLARLTSLRTAAARTAGTVAMAAFDCLYPPRCALCQARTAHHEGVCGQCWARLSLIDRPLDDHRGVPLPFDPDAGDVTPANPVLPSGPFAWDRLRAAVVFDEHSRRLVHALKYRDRHESAGVMARMMARAGRELVTATSVLVPVPLHRWRLWRRRFNQSAVLASRIVAVMGKGEVSNALRRVRAGRPQVGLSARQRRDNVRAAFAVDAADSGEIFGRHVVLIDDVVTTGASVHACARALKKAGADRVDVLAFALVSDGPKAHI